MRLSLVQTSLCGFGLSLLGCVGGEHQERPEGPLDGRDAASADADVGTRQADAAHHAGQILDASVEELAAALDASGFRNDGRRGELVVAALCRQRVTCGDIADENGCRANFRIDWHDRVAQGRGLHVPCHDALLDTISCRAAAACGDSSACDALVRTEDTVCAQGPLPSQCGAWVPGSDSHDGGALTKGPIPPEAQNPDGRGLKWELVPDFIPALAKDGSIAGYIRKVDLMDLGCETKTVVDETLQTVVGHMVAGIGFVPRSTSVSDAGP